MGDVKVVEDGELRVSPFRRFDLLKATRALRDQWEEQKQDQRLIDKLYTYVALQRDACL
jgi:hypothetical protein